MFSWKPINRRKIHCQLSNPAGFNISALNMHTGMTILLMITLTVAVFTSGIQAEEIPSPYYGKETYRRHCTPCHGAGGDGKGFNAKNLDPRPANHTDTQLMSKRTDKDLYDVVYGGGRDTGKSTLMPPWGNTFSRARIESLVLYMRKLCGCKGPDHLQ